MAKRILLMGSHPGRIKKEIINDLPYPRQEGTNEFNRMVSQIHGLIAETFMPDVQVPSELADKTIFEVSHMPLKIKKRPIETLPNVQMFEMIGLLESIADDGGHADIFDLAHRIEKDYGRTLYLVKALELLNLVDTPKQHVVITQQGHLFVSGDINLRKSMLHELFGELRIVQMTEILIRRNDSLRIPIDQLTERVQRWLPNENSQQIVLALVSWGRFAEYFGYNDDTKEIYLDIGQETI